MINADNPVPTRSVRTPRLIVAAWGVAAAAVAVLVVAVWHYLGSNGAMDMSMGGGNSHSAVALTRAGSRGPFGPLTEHLFTSWQLDAVALAVLVLAAAAYLTGVALAGVRNPEQPWPLRRTLSFLAGLGVCVIATCGSIAVYDQVLFTAHMAGHLALVMVAPALIMWGRPLRLLLLASPPARRARIERVMQGPAMSVVFAPPVALAGYAAVIVGSHLTGLMNTIMRNTWAGQVEHLVYVIAGCWFFALVVGDEPIRWRLASPARWLLLAIAMAVDTFTGIVLMQGTQAIHLAPSTLDVNALSDTRTGGAMMWFGGDAIMAAIMIALVVGWLRRVDSTPVEQGWLEQARRATFSTHTGTAETAEPLDDDDDAREAYNRWLQKLDS